MTRAGRDLIGSWRREPGESCGPDYAAELHFGPDGLYEGTTDPPGEFTWWDSGTWLVTEAGRVSLSIANDAVVSYRYELTADRLTIVDPSGCRVTYRRQPDAPR